VEGWPIGHVALRSGSFGNMVTYVRLLREVLSGTCVRLTSRAPTGGVEGIGDDQYMLYGS
jgi:hypothetical protein